MAETAARETPAVTLSRCAPRGRIDLRGDAADPAFAAGVSSVIGVEPPSTANTGRSATGAVILWLGPDEWLVEVAAAAESEVAKARETALSGLHASVEIVGDGSVTLSLAGGRAADVLAKGMTLDLAPDRFGAGCCARSLLARVPVLLYRPGQAAVYEITVARSFSDYALRWLDDAALEYRQTS
ncbi:MAG: sarcosine oxidase subunit gamma [Acidobacteria bacterium]|nr:sarcosine oxidase subunit gamma [Acidobacteriota bacterium]